MNKKYTILLDLDGVLCDWSNEIARIHLSTHPYDPYPELKEWSMWKSFGDSPDMKKKFLTDSSEGGYYDIAMQRAFPYMGAHNFVVRLSSQANLKLVTARDSKYYKLTKDWLDYYHFSRHFSEIILTHDKNKIEGDILIDDKPANIQSFHDIGRNAILFRRAWNRYYDYDGFGAYCYEDILMYLHYNKNFQFFYENNQLINN